MFCSCISVFKVAAWFFNMFSLTDGSRTAAARGAKVAGTAKAVPTAAIGAKAATQQDLYTIFIYPIILSVM
jgi:hypothetical protein